MYAIRQEWIDGIRTPETHSIKEWESVGKPQVKNKVYNSNSLNHIFGNPINEINQIINQTFKK